jgi:hypothetical protein
MCATVQATDRIRDRCVARHRLLSGKAVTIVGLLSRGTLLAGLYNWVEVGRASIRGEN